MIIDEKKLGELRGLFVLWSRRDASLGPDDFESMLNTIGVLWKVARAAQPLAKAFVKMREDHHSRLVVGQTLESASANWGSLIQEPLEFGPLLEALADLPEANAI